MLVDVDLDFGFDLWVCYVAVLLVGCFEFLGVDLDLLF